MFEKVKEKFSQARMNEEARELAKFKEEEDRHRDAEMKAFGRELTGEERQYFERWKEQKQEEKRAKLDKMLHPENRLGEMGSIGDRLLENDKQALRSMGDNLLARGNKNGLTDKKFFKTLGTR